VSKDYWIAIDREGNSNYHNPFAVVVLEGGDCTFFGTMHVLSKLSDQICKKGLTLHKHPILQL